MAAIRGRFSRIDALFVNAGAGCCSWRRLLIVFHDTFNVNVKAFYSLCGKVPLMPSGSAVVLNASINGHMALPSTTVYTASKAAVIGLARLSIELVSGASESSISPGPIESTFLSRELPAEELQQTKDWIVSQVPMKRFGQPEDIAAAVLYLTSPESAYVIGADLIIDGGMKTLS
jgi:NAD(P)-dependent dehydrogenase (short-subunit alcohol dehydrogenase family)